MPVSELGCFSLFMTSVNLNVNFNIKSMEEDFVNKEQDAFTEIYESPSIDVKEIDIEKAILQVSGEDSTNQTW